MDKQCNCGKGHVSLWDNKCGHCRTKKEQKDHETALRDLEVVTDNTGKSPGEAYDYLRKLYK
jgi:hypothetical protein